MRQRAAHDGYPGQAVNSAHMRRPTTCAARLSVSSVRPVSKARQLVWLAGMLDDMKIKDVLRLLEDDDWYLVKTRGSHRQFKHPYKTGRVTVAGKPSDDLAPGTLNSILKQAGLKR